jgi:pyruvate formate lyase activating enzyme
MKNDDNIDSPSATAIIFDIQRFSLHDGPGIRTTIFFKGCPLSCAWCQNPESQRIRPELIFYEERCIRCFICSEICSENAISENSTLRFNPKQCNVCGNCVSNCTTNSLRIVGKKWNADDLINEIAKDIDFFIDSRGGITLSGGEPFLHTEFLLQWLPKVQKKKIHITIETCGMVKWKQIEKLLPLLDLVFYDLKHMNDTVHKQYTGQGNTRILKNFSKLSKNGKGLQARMPVIPGVNDTPENIKATADFLKTNDQNNIHLLPYHNLGEAKLNKIDTQLRPLNIAPLNSEQLQEIQKLFKKEEIHAVLYD